MEIDTQSVYGVRLKLWVVKELVLLISMVLNVRFLWMLLKRVPRPLGQSNKYPICMIF